MTQCLTDHYTTVLRWEIPARYEGVFPGKGSIVDGEERAFKRLDKLERQPYETLKEWHRKPIDSLSHRLRRHVEREEPGVVRARFEDEDGRELTHGRLRVVAYDVQHQPQAVIKEFDLLELTESHPPQLTFTEPGVGPGRVLAVEFRPYDHDVTLGERCHVSLPVTIIDDKKDEIRSTTASWDC